METATAMTDDDSAVPPEPSRPPLEATWTIVLDNIGLVHRIARDCCPYRNDRDDLIQEGMLGLLEAARRFDPSRQVAFSTYAYYWIRNRILTALREERSDTSTTKSGYVEHPPFDVSLDALELFGKVGDELQSSEPILDPPEADYIRNDLARDLKEHLVNDLDEIERLVVVLHWLSPDPTTLDDIAKALGLRSRSSVLAVEQLALAKLRQAMSRRRK